MGGVGEALDRQAGPEPGPDRFVVFLRVSLQGLLTGEGFLALIAGKRGPRHRGLQFQVQFDADTEKYCVRYNCATS